MPMLIGPNQCSFVPGRHATNNVVIVWKNFHSMHKRKGKSGFMAVEVDLKKAYDWLRWDFLIDTLKEVLFNGAPTDEFSPSRGVRQGDLISPYLFVLCMERLVHLIEREVTYNN
ncbi:putative mitochondrial protein, partial [Mucuna pruriens]